MSNLHKIRPSTESSSVRSAIVVLLDPQNYAIRSYEDPPPAASPSAASPAVPPAVSSIAKGYARDLISQARLFREQETDNNKLYRQHNDGQKKTLILTRMRKMYWSSKESELVQIRTMLQTVEELDPFITPILKLINSFAFCHYPGRLGVSFFHNYGTLKKLLSEELFTKLRNREAHRELFVDDPVNVPVITSPVYPLFKPTNLIAFGMKYEFQLKNCPVASHELFHALERRTEEELNASTLYGNGPSTNASASFA
ncbi:hypothetical protein BJ508DRAFT_326167 [Ascobolus immersus RN42]|uniref:Uncharacterized protein n=1 Tax=Ascobolus immersus RN42 TaxID=1160509 RepID=A0A3N4I8B6_ASCIM|nr:hypothetical protein BJ508DRAFT_326167 [Ascobolus immersus RN42]